MMSNCEVPIELQEFNKNKAKKDGLNSICRECSKKKSKEYYNLNKDVQKQQIYASRTIRRRIAVKFVRDYATSRGCVDCKERDFLVLDFDHVRGQKYKNISVLLTDGASIEVIERELEKCDVRCANCHRRRTAQQQNWYKFLDGELA